MKQANVRPALRLALAAAICLAIVACGGGVGSGGGAEPSALSLANVRSTAVDQEVFEGGDLIAPVTITADVKGNLQQLANATIYVIVQDSDQLFSQTPQLNVNANGQDNTLVIGGRSQNTKVGDFRGTLAISVCMDARCNSPFVGSPIQIPYHVKVVPGLKLAEQGEVTLVSSFPATSAPWTSRVVLPSGATDFDAILGLGGTGIDPSATLTMSRDADSITLQGKPSPAGEHQATLSVFANAVTSRGRGVRLSTERSVSYRVAASSGVAMFYTPAQPALSMGSGSGWHDSEYVSALASDGLPYGAGRVEYMPPGQSGNLDAGNVRWLLITPLGTYGGPELYYTKFLFQISPCVGSFPRCLPVGVYQARMFPTTATGVESPQPVTITLTVQP